MTALTVLADWIEGQLADELGSRQALAETVLARLRVIADPAAADKRISAAGEYLGHARRIDVHQAPRRELARAVAELRRQLGIVLAVTAATAPDLAPADRDLVFGALDHAEQLMRERVDAYCVDCATSPAEACEQHLDDLDLADAYQALATRLEATR